jgi:lantibiotic modifying enzyme
MNRGGSILSEPSSPLRKIDNRFTKSLRELKRSAQRRGSERSLPFDAKAEKIARELKVYLARENRSGCARHRIGRTDSCEQIIAPAVDLAIARLRHSAGRDSKIVRDSAWQDLREHLSARLAFALTPTLQVLQSAARAAGFRDEITLVEAIAEFPDLLDTIARLISGWINAQRELLARIRRDVKTIRKIFFHTCDRLYLRRVRAGLSDPHDGGRTTTMLEFGKSRRLIYKPRSADGEKIWFAALRWLNRNDFSFRLPTIFARRNYFWMEFLGDRQCDTKGALRRFYFRWGAQVAIAQLLGANDLHRENWLAVGSQPVLVDSEFVGQSQTRLRHTGSALDRQSLPALLETGVLPLTSRDRGGEYRGIAPLDATISKNGSPPCWPRYNGKLQAPSKYVNDLLHGFETVAELFEQPFFAKKFFADVVIRAASGRRIRILFRASAHYSRLLRESLHPRNMVSKLSRWRYLARECSRTALNREIGLAEADALIRCDIPKFTRPLRTPPSSWQQFSTAVAELKNSSRLLRSRVSLRARDRRDFNAKRNPLG